MTELALEQRMLAATFFWRSTNPHLNLMVVNQIQLVKKKMLKLLWGPAYI